MKLIFFGCLTLAGSPQYRWVAGCEGGNAHRYYASGIAKSSSAFIAKMIRKAKAEFPGWHIVDKIAYEISQDDIRETLSANYEMKLKRKAKV